MNDPTSQPEAIKLPPSYDSCLLGATVSIRGADQFCYSLRKLIRFTMMEHACPASEAREIIVRDFIGPYSAEVCFVNDELVEGSIEDTEKPLIIRPPQFNGRN